MEGAFFAATGSTIAADLAVDANATVVFVCFFGGVFLGVTFFGAGAGT